ncbi:MAG: glycosyltransferase family 1 protein, partial [Actinomycetia bacterium]|nr:glycosyltransferase family 1 protein [Actinomycetes bacterium]
RGGLVLGRNPTLVARGAPPVARRCLVVGSLEAWDDVWRRNQFLVRELTAADPSLRVLFVEPPSDPLYDTLIRHIRPEIRGGRLRPVPGNPQVIRYRPVKFAPRRFGGWADRSMTRQVLRAAARAEVSEPTLWINDLNLVHLAARVSRPVLYDMTDDWLAVDVGPRELARLTALEERLLAIAGSVVVCSPGLAATKATTRPVTLVPNAVDVERFREPRARPVDLPTGPVALYVGTLHDERIDVELLLQAARELPEVQFALVGPSALSSTTTAQLAALPNVHRLGPRPHEDVPAYLQHASVIIVPHVVSGFTESLDPIKAYECLAVDTPTLATPVAGFRELAGSITIADRSRYVQALRDVLDRSAPVTDLPPRAVPSWADRATEFDAALRDAPRSPSLAFDPPLRVVYVGHTARLSGGELALARLLPALQDLGVETHVILGEDGPLVAELRSVGVAVEVLPLGAAARDLRKDRVTPTGVPLGSALQTLRYVRRLARRLEELDPAIVHTNTLKAAVYGGAAARLARIPVVWHIRDRIASDYLPAASVFALRLLAKTLPNAVITNSRATRATLGTLENRAAAVPSPVTYDSVRQPLEAEDRPARPFTVGILGRLSPWKGQHVFLEAFARAFPRGPERAVVVGGALFGEDGYAASLPVLAEQLGIGDRVHFAGFQNDIFAALAEIDVLVHASTLPEPFGQVIIEGMAAGLPVIATAAGGPLEIITDEVDGLFVPPDDPAAMARALVRLARSPELRARLGARASLRAERFRPERIAADVANLYRRMLPIGTTAG